MERRGGSEVFLRIGAYLKREDERICSPSLVSSEYSPSEQAKINLVRPDSRNLNDVLVPGLPGWQMFGARALR